MLLDLFYYYEIVITKSRDTKILYYMKTIKGYIHLNARGKGFVKYGNDGKEVAILQRDTNFAIEGDYVLISNIHTFKDKLEGTVIKIIKRVSTEILGVITVKVHNTYTVYSQTIQAKIECTLDKYLSIEVLTVNPRHSVLLLFPSGPYCTQN